MNWGKWIIVSFVLFAGFIATLVTVCVRQDISLVSKDYYKEELEFEGQMTRMKNVALLKNKPAITIQKGGVIEITFDNFAEIEKGKLTLFRPSDSSQDKVFDLRASNKAKQVFLTDDLDAGMYRARMQWSMKGKEYFLEEVVYL